MFIPSTDCTGDLTCHSHKLYNSSLSNTGKMSDTLLAVDYAHCSVFGNLASDTITLAGLTVSQQFGAIDSVRRFADSDWGNMEWDGLLGLAPSSTHSPNSISNPFLNFQSQNLIPKSIFTLLLPQTPETPGVLTFGTINRTLYTEPLKLLPLLNQHPISEHHLTTLSDRIPSRWQVPCKSLTISGTSSSYNFHPYIALLETNYQVLVFHPLQYSPFTTISAWNPTVSISLSRSPVPVVIRSPSLLFILGSMTFHFWLMNIRWRWIGKM